MWFLGALFLIVLLLAIPFTFGGITAHLVAKKGRNKVGYFFLGFFFSFFGIIIALLVSDLNQENAQDRCEHCRYKYYYDEKNAFNGNNSNQTLKEERAVSAEDNGGEPRFEYKTTRGQDEFDA